MSIFEPTLTLFDVDYTLFRTSANVLVLKDGQVSKKLTSTQYNSYRLNEGEKFDYSEFKNAKVFYDTSIPILPAIRKIRDIIARHLPRHPDNKLVILTARNIFDNPALFKQKFTDSQIDITKCEFEFCGEMFVSPTWVAKTLCAQKYIAEFRYSKVRLFDDADENLKGFLALRRLYPHTTFEAYKVSPEGAISAYDI